MSDLDEQAADVRGRGRRASGGASIVMKDPRVTGIIDWAQPIITGGVLAGILYFANQVGALRDAVVDTNKQLALTLQQNSRLTEDVRDHEGRIRTLEGRTLRGEQEPIILPSEKRRGH